MAAATDAMKASPFWLIAVPNERDSQESYNKIYEAVVPTNYADITPFNIPDLRVGTLDSLMVLPYRLHPVIFTTLQTLSDSLVKVDRGIASLISTIQRHFADVKDPSEVLTVNKDGRSSC
jgi:hypothetical protein